MRLSNVMILNTVARNNRFEICIYDHIHIRRVSLDTNTEEDHLIPRGTSGEYVGKGYPVGKKSIKNIITSRKIGLDCWTRWSLSCYR